MPRKAKVVTEEEKPDEFCGHVNRHASPEMVCSLPKEHNKLHGTWSEKKVWTEWSDMAGTPVDQIPNPGEVRQKTLAELDFGMTPDKIL